MRKEVIITVQDDDIPCSVCGRPLTVSATGPGSWIMACGYLDDDPKEPGHLIPRQGRTVADEHYSKSRMEFGSYDGAQMYALRQTIRRLREQIEHLQEVRIHENGKSCPL